MDVLIATPRGRDMPRKPIARSGILPSPGTTPVFHWRLNNVHIGADEAALRCARSALSVPGTHEPGIDSGYHARPSHEFRRFAGAAPTALVAQRGPHLNHLLLD